MTVLQPHVAVILNKLMGFLCHASHNLLLPLCVPALRSWADAGPFTTNCDNLGGAGGSAPGVTNSPVEVAALQSAISPAAGNPLRGCAPAGAVACPSIAAYFWQSGTAGELIGTGTAASRCLTSPPTSCAGSVAVVDSDAATQAGPLIGCIGTTPMLPTTAGCPVTLPVAGDFTFFVASYEQLGTTNNVAGNIVECRRNTLSRQCMTALPVRQYSTVTPSGCLININRVVNSAGVTPNECPGGWMASRGFTFPLWQATAPGATGDATAKLEACITAPLFSGIRSCRGVVPANTWTNDVSNDTLSTLTASSSLLVGCARPEAACPVISSGTVPTYPLINATMQITGCRSNAWPSGGSECSSQYLPLCEGVTVNNAPTLIDVDGTCTAARTRGCVITAGTSSVSTCYPRQQNGYPTPGGFSNFVMSLQGGAPVQASVRACFATLSSATCGPGGVAPGPGVYSVRVTSQGAFRGCTDSSEAACANWWPLQPGVAAGLCTQQ
jgi:hypothetical protein